MDCHQSSVSSIASTANVAATLTKTAIVLLAVPFSAVGAIWLIYFLGYHWSIAVWVGLIALAGLDAETGVVMLLYLDIAYDRRGRRPSSPRMRGPTPGSTSTCAAST